MINVGRRFASRAHFLYIIPAPQRNIVRRAANWTEAINKRNSRVQQRMGASWSAIANKEKAASILWTSVDSQPTTKLYDDFKVSVGLSEDATKRIAGGASWQIDFEVDVAHLQKRLDLCVQTSDDSSVQRLTVEGDTFRNIIEHSRLSNDDLCNVCAIRFKLETREEEVCEFCLVTDISRDGMSECPTGKLLRRVYGNTKQTVPERLA